MSPLLTGVLASQISGHLNTYTLTGSYDALATVTVPSGGASSIVFSSIPSTYTHLQIRGIAKDAGANNNNTASPYLNINNDSGSNYAIHALRGDGSNATAFGYASQSSITLYGAGIGNATSSIFGGFITDILDYTTNKNKTVRTLAGNDSNGVGVNHISLSSGVWLSTNAINSLTITSASSGNFAQYSSFALYGVK